MHGWYGNAACALGAHHWSFYSGPLVSWIVWWDPGVLSQPGHNILKFSEVHMGVDIVCHSLVYSVEEGRSFCLDHSLFLFAGSRHPLCMHLQGFGFQGCKDVSEVVLAVRCVAVEEEPVLQGMPKNGERVVCIFRVPVIDGRADGCSSSCQPACNGISCGLGRLSDELLWGWFWGHVSVPGWSDNGQIRKRRGVGHKNGCNLGTVSLICLIFGQHLPDGVLYLYVCCRCATTSVSVPQCHYNAHVHSGDAFWVLDSYFMLILALRIGKC